MHKFCFVIPFLNEAESLPSLIGTISQECSTFLAEHEEEFREFQFCCVLVNDGSVDHFEAPLANALEGTVFEEVVLVNLSRNWGHQRALACGIKKAIDSGADWLCLMDADGQDPAHVVFDMFEMMREKSADVVFAVRRTREGSKTLAFLYNAFYRIMLFASDSPVQRNSGDFSVITRRVAKMMTEDFSEVPEYLRGMRAYVGLRQIGFEYDRPNRADGESKYSFKKLLSLAKSGVMGFSKKPLSVATYFGFLLTGINFFLLSFSLIQWVFDIKIFGRSPQDIPGYMSLFFVSNIFLGFLFIYLGIMSSYIGYIFDEVKRRPPYLVESEKSFRRSKS